MANLLPYATDLPEIEKRRKVKKSEPANDLVFSSYKSGHDDVLPNILNLYAPKGSVVADIMYGHGGFWKNIDLLDSEFYPSDLTTGTYCRDLSYQDGYLDSVIFDPPYLHSPGGTTNLGHQHFEKYYKNNLISSAGAKYQEFVLELYFNTAEEVFRVLGTNGVFIVKCQDEVCSNRQRLTHIEIIKEYECLGFTQEKSFISPSFLKALVSSTRLEGLK